MYDPSCKVTLIPEAGRKGSINVEGGSINLSKRQCPTGFSPQDTGPVVASDLKLE
jgi:hypothetical protein